MRVHLLLYDGFAERDAIGALDVLYAARAAGADVSVELVRLASATVTSAHGLSRHVPLRVEPTPVPDVLVVPGAPWLAEPAVAGWAEQQRRRIAEALAMRHRSGTALAAAGTGVLLLADAGLLDGRPVAAAAAVRDALAAAGARVVEAAAVDDGDLLSACGAAAGLELGLLLVERAAGADAARAAGVAVEHERRA